MQLIFETERFYVRKLKESDFDSFHEMQGNSHVMQFVRSKPMTYKEDKAELLRLIKLYNETDNDFWIFAVELKSNSTFVGSVALVRSSEHRDVTDDNNLVLNIKKDQCEIGYRLLEKFWRKGYASEIVKGLINYCREIGFTKLIACVANENIASAKIIKNLEFQFVENFIAEDLKIPEQKFILYL